MEYRAKPGKARLQPGFFGVGSAVFASRHERDYNKYYRYHDYDGDDRADYRVPGLGRGVGGVTNSMSVGGLVKLKGCLLYTSDAADE